MLWVHCFEGTLRALTDTEIKKAKPQEKPYKLSDGAGLYVWVTPSGGKKWRASYRHEEKQKTMTFGGYPEVSLALARERHRNACRLLAEGLDPMEQRKAVKTAHEAANMNSFASVAALWLEHWQEGESAVTSIPSAVGSLRTFFPRWGRVLSKPLKLPKWSS